MTQPAESNLCDGDLLDAWSRDQHGPALEVLVQRYSRMVLSVCHRRCRTEADADDAYQTTFLYLARNAARIRNPERLAGWLHRVAQRASTATLPSKHSQVEPMVEPPAISTDPLQQLTQRHEAIVLDEELADLPEDYRAAIVLHLYEGLSLQTLADRLETTTGSIRGRLQRGKKLLARRLRHRGIVPVVAIASATAWSVSNVQATSAAENLTGQFGDVGLPNPPIETSLLDSLLAQGVRAVPAFTTTTGVIGGAALIAALLIANGTNGQTESDSKVVSLPAADVEPHARFQLGGGGTPPGLTVDGNSTAPSGSLANPNQQVPATASVQRLAVPKADSATAKKIEKLLETSIEGPLDMKRLEEMPDVPIFIDNRALAEAKINLETAEIGFEGKAMPLRSALRKMLQPHALKYEIENDGMVITSDFEELSHRGFPMSRWIDADQETQDAFEKQLQAETTQHFDQTPLNEAMRQISDAHDIPIMIDAKALEEINLSEEEPVTLSVENVSLRSLLTLILRELDLTYSTQNEVMEITTIEIAEQNLRHRIYWLEGTGFPAGEFDPLIELIETTIAPETWESLGGPSNMQPINQKRPAIVVSTMTVVHQKIERLLAVFRESNFGPPPVIENVQVE